jgi:hypothetical protein
VARRTEVKVRITGESRSAERAAKKTESAFSRLGKTLKSNLLLTIGSVTLAITGLIRGLGSLIRAANKQEDAIRGLDAALSALGPSAEGVSKRLQEQAAALQKVTTAGDETIIKGQALIATFTQNEEEIKKSTEAALNLSAAVGVDLNAAFLLMGKAASGETSTLSRYGIILDEGIPKSEKFAAVLGLIEDKMGGRAQAAAETFSGRVAQLSNAFGDLTERLGEGITKNEGFGESLKDLTVFIQENEGSIVRLAAAISGVLSEAIGGAVDKLNQLGTAVGTVIVKLREWAGVNAEVEVSEAALAATAERLGISIAEVKRRIEEAAAASLASIGAVDGLATAEDNAGDSAGNLANKLGEAGGAALAVVDNFKTATEAAVGLGNALGEVTSVELKLQIQKDCNGED